MAWATLPADVCWALNEYERQRAVLSADCATPAGKGVAFGHCFPSFFPALRAYKVKGKVETFLKKSFIKKLYARFARHSAARTSHCIYTMRNSGWLNSTTWPLPTQISATVPSSSAGISFISFMASMMHSVSPFFTWSPTSTKGRASGLGAE